MALVKIVLDPNAAPELTPDAVVAKVNAASVNISRASSVTAAARPIADSEVTETKIAASAITSGKVASGVAKANLDSMEDTARGYIKTAPISGQFPVITLEQKADGKIEVAVDDVAIP